MAYATAQDMVESFGSDQMQQLSDIEPPLLGAMNNVVVLRALTSASALMDGYLVGRYAVPLESPPDAMRVHCVGVARYLLMTNAPDERAKSDFGNAMSFLKQVAAGTVPLLPPSVAQAPAGVGTVMFCGGEKVFSRGAV